MCKVFARAGLEHLCTSGHPLLLETIAGFEKIGAESFHSKIIKYNTIFLEHLQQAT